jgi:hypothetical protein
MKLGFKLESERINLSRRRGVRNQQGRTLMHLTRRSRYHYRSKGVEGCEGLYYSMRVQTSANTGDYDDPLQSNPDIRMSFGDSKIKDIAGYPYIENSIK